MLSIELMGRSLAVEDRGSGDPVLLLHPGFVADGMRPLMAESALSAGRRLVAYHRRGYGRSGGVDGPVSIAEQADDVLALMDHLGIDTADLVGHSLGAVIGLEVALAAPERVRSLVAMEPLLLFALSPETAQFVADTAAVAMPLFAAGDRAAAVDAWLSGAFGAGFRETLDRAVPGAFEQAVRDSGAAFGVEVPSLQGWTRGPEDLCRLAAPTLSVVNDGSAWRGFRETHDRLLEWLPRAAGVSVAARSHLLQIEQPALVADAVADFLDHPIR
jgi:pimeloyl-ACP methyl ester carboxylesterase